MKKKKEKRNKSLFSKLNKIFVFVMCATVLIANTIISYSNGCMKENIALASTIVSTLSTASVVSNTNKTISIRVKASVPKGFKDNITLSYIGENGYEFTAELNYETDYIHDLVVPEDNYILKVKSTTNTGYVVDVYNSFSLVNASTDNVYVLPVNVISSTNSDTNLSNVSISVEAEIPKNYKGDITVNYSGTNNNQSSTILTKDNDYKANISVPFDLYTVDNIIVSEGYTADSIKSFDLKNADVSNLYVLSINVKETEPTIEIKPETEPKKEVDLQEASAEAPIQPVQEPIQSSDVLYEENQPSTINTSVNVKAVVPEDFDKSIYICYTGSGQASNGFNCELNKLNNYFVNLPLPEDTYSFLYAQTTEPCGYTFKSVENFAITKEMTAPYDIVIEAVAENDVPDNEEVTESDSSLKSNTKEGRMFKNFNFDGTTITGIGIIIGGIAFFVMKYLNKKSSNKKVSYDEDEVEQEMNFDDDDINLD